MNFINALSTYKFEKGKRKGKQNTLTNKHNYKLYICLKRNVLTDDLKGYFPYDCVNKFHDLLAE